MSSKVPTSFPPCSDGAIWDIWMSQQHLPTVSVALELNVFEFIASKSTGATAAEVAAALSLTPRAVDALLGVLASLSLLSSVCGVFTLTPTASAFLISSSEFYWGHMLRGDRSEMHARLKKCVESDKPVGAVLEWEGGELTADRARFLTAEMHSHSTSAALVSASVLAPLFTGPTPIRTLLDVAGGSAIFACSFAQRAPDLRCTVLELPVVCKLVEEEYIPKGLSTRINTVSLNMFTEDWPAGYDAHFFSNVWHDWNDVQCANLAARSFKALAPGGKILLHEMLLSESKDGPLTTACFSMHMFVYTKGRQYTFTSLAALLTAAGFVDITSVKCHHMYSVVIGVKPLTA